ncbi:MAG: hypothetical protein FJ301_14235 [Planctomycetes bacterium]|nr:hypothetical protein [Planctomycetota bacterium]
MTTAPTTIALLLALLLTPVAAQEQPATPPPATAAAKAAAQRIDDLIASMRAAEAKLQAVSLRMATEGRLPGGLVVSVRGELRAHYGDRRATYARFAYETGDGLRGSAESAQSAAGITLREDDPAFGEVFVAIEPAIVADLEWAGRVLQRDDLPGMTDKAASSPERRAESPLGSGLLSALRRQFDLAIEARDVRDGAKGTWLAGPRRASLGADDPDLPVADRVEVFVRAADLALVSMRQLLGEQAVQIVTVEELTRDPKLGDDAFVVAAPAAGGKPKPVQQFAPLWESIQQACVDAEAKAEKAAAARNKDVPAGQQTPAEVRPSKR